MNISADVIRRVLPTLTLKDAASFVSGKHSVAEDAIAHLMQGHPKGTLLIDVPVKDVLFSMLFSSLKHSQETITSENPKSGDAAEELELFRCPHCKKFFMKEVS